MVYIDHNGRVWEKRPWDWRRIVELFVGIWFAIKQLFLTFLAPFMGTDNQANPRRGNGWGGGGGGGGGWGGGGGGGGGGGSGGRPGSGGLRPNRRIGRIQPSMSCNMPAAGG